MQEQKSSCVNCGAELMPEARFCRRCGQPSNPLDRGSVTEVTTRRLETPGQPFMPGQNMTGQQAMETSGQTRAGLTAETQSLAPSSPFKKWLPVLLVLCVVILLPLFHLLIQWRKSTIRIVPTAPQTPSIPQPPPPPAAADTKSVPFDQRFVYPGARTTMIISKAGQGSTMQLQTDDSVDKVADWYIERLKPEKTLRAKDNVVLKSDEASVIITANGSGTNIMLKQSAD
jgi:hypothetical protein